MIKMIFIIDSNNNDNADTNDEHDMKMMTMIMIKWWLRYL